MNNKPNRYFAEVFFRSKKGNPCALHQYMNASDHDEAYEKIVRKVKKLKYFDRVDRVDIHQLQNS